MNIDRPNKKIAALTGTENPPLKIQPLKKSGLWRSISTSSRPYTTVKTGFSELDNLLALGGWPLQTSAEIALSKEGIGELRLLLPALQQCFEAVGKNHTVWIAPPHLPYAPALMKHNITPSNLIIVRPQGVANILWAAEQALLSDSCAAVFTWTGAYKLSHKESRRLQLAVEKSSAWHVQFRHTNCLQHPSAARLRLGISSNAHGQLDIAVHRQPQGASDLGCTVSMKPGYENWQIIPVNLLPHNNSAFQPARKTKQPQLGHGLLTD